MKNRNHLPMQDGLQEYEPLAGSNILTALVTCVQTFFIVLALFVMLALEWCGLLRDPVTNPVNELFAPRFKWPWRKERKGGEK